MVEKKYIFLIIKNNVSAHILIFYLDLLSGNIKHLFMKNNYNPVSEYKKEALKVKVFASEKEMGAMAAEFVWKKLKDVLEKKGYANMILATGASQFTFLDALKQKDLDWLKITVFHLDEYKGMSDQHPASFRKYLKERILNKVKPGKVYLINGDAENLKEEIKKYEISLKGHEIDIACIGIGENGHIAFNDPPVADFNDSKLVKVVDLDEACRNQQLGEGWFPTLNDVPKQAITLTIPAIMRCKTISCVVPGVKKTEAVHNTLNGAVSTACPATILRTHNDVTLFLDKDSANI